MSYGIEVYGESGSLLLGPQTVGWTLVDSFVVNAGANGSKTYSDVPSGVDLAVAFVPVDLTFSEAYYPTQELGSIEFSVNSSLKAVSWSWVGVNVIAYLYDQAVVQVFAR